MFHEQEGFVVVAIVAVFLIAAVLVELFVKFGGGKALGGVSPGIGGVYESRFLQYEEKSGIHEEQTYHEITAMRPIGTNL